MSLSGNGPSGEVMKVAFIDVEIWGASLAKALTKEVAGTDLLLVNRSPQRWKGTASMGGTASDLKQVFQRRRSSS